jgi:murein L,D-transpeptidase YcbB/YkuD
LKQQAQKAVAVDIDLPVIILYSTVLYIKDGELRFYDDVYKKLDR